MIEFTFKDPRQSNIRCRLWVYNPIVKPLTIEFEYFKDNFEKWEFEHGKKYSVPEYVYKQIPSDCIDTE